MKKILTLTFLLTAFLSLTFESTAQQFFPLNYTSNNTATHGIKIKTKLPFQNQSAMPTVILEGYDYNRGQPIGIILNWYIFNNEFIRYKASFHGGYAPSIQLANEDGKVVIFIDDRSFFIRFQVRVYGSGLSQETPENYSDWEAVDEPLTGTDVVNVEYSSGASVGGSDPTPDAWEDNGSTITTDNKVEIDNILRVEDGFNNHMASFINTSGGSNAGGVLIETTAGGQGSTDALKVLTYRSNSPQLALRIPNFGGLGNRVLLVESGGKVGIGTDLPEHELDICGFARAKEIIVETDWCDYVFDEKYSLPTLTEQKSFIEKNGHLKNFESEKEMGGQALVGDIQKRQQQTLEEMMLYLIKMEEEMKALRAEIVELKKDKFKQEE